MEELQLALTSARIDQRNFGLWLSNWRVGQTLTALVTGQLPTGELVLRIDGRQVTATSDIPVQQGARLMLEVKQLQPQPMLRIASGASASITENVSGTLQLVARGGTAAAGATAGASLAVVSQGLLAAMAGSSVAGTILAPLLTQLRQLARPERLVNADGLEAALRASGLFMESSIATGAPESSDGQDLKAGLFRSLASIEAEQGRLAALAPAAADASEEDLLLLQNEVRSGLARIVLQQLNSVPPEGASLRQWHFDLPVYMNGEFHSLRLVIEGDDRARGESGDDDGQWSVRLSVDPPALGRIDIRVALRGESVRMDVEAAQASTRSIVDRHLQILEGALAAHGLALRAGPARAIAPVRQAADEATRASGLDVRA